MDDFLSKENCDRCGDPLRVRTMSWFTDEVICVSCSEGEDSIKEQLREEGKDPSLYEGCGYIPEIQKGGNK